MMYTKTMQGKTTSRKMTHEKKLKFYKELKIKIAQDGKSHKGMLTEDGAFIDGKLYPFKKENLHKSVKNR